MAKIYVVTKGSYSDYSIITATLDEEKAKKLAEKFSDEWDTAEVEVYEDSDIYFKPVWFVKFDTNGDVYEVSREEDSCEYAYQCIGDIRRDVRGRVMTYVSADTSEKAVKIASEKYAAFVAKEKGLI